MDLDFWTYVARFSHRKFVSKDRKRRAVGLLFYSGTILNDQCKQFVSFFRELRDKRCANHPSYDNDTVYPRTRPYGDGLTNRAIGRMNRIQQRIDFRNRPDHHVVAALRPRLTNSRPLDDWIDSAQLTGAITFSSQSPSSMM